jgi:hypothetical protein
MRPASGSGRGASRQARGRSGREDVAAQSLCRRLPAPGDDGSQSESEDKPARDLPFLPDESSWLQDPNNVRGLRSVSVRMCHLLRQKQTCTCNEVADQLTEESQAAATREQADAKSDSGSPVPEKNLRRRIYDALNVHSVQSHSLIERAWTKRSREPTGCAPGAKKQTIAYSPIP